MNSTSTNGASRIEDGVNSILEDAKHKICDKCESCEERIRESPGKAVLIAVAAGYCLHRLPIRSLLAANVRLIGALAPPAIFLYGAAKVCEYLQDRGHSPSSGSGKGNTSAPANGI